MPANAFNAFTDYGIGIGLRIPHYDHILAQQPTVDWFEIISENYLVDGGRPLEVLDRVPYYRGGHHGHSSARMHRSYQILKRCFDAAHL